MKVSFFALLMLLAAKSFAQEIDLDKLFSDEVQPRSHQLESSRTSAEELRNAERKNSRNSIGKSALDAMGSSALKALAEGTANSSSYSTYIPCNSGDKCFNILKKISDYRYEIECTKGRGGNIGKKGEICGKDFGEKWASGCGMGDAFAYHYNSIIEAGNKACGG